MDAIYGERGTGFRANLYRNQKGKWCVAIHIPAESPEDAHEMVLALAKTTRDFRRSQVVPLHPGKT